MPSSTQMEANHINAITKAASAIVQEHLGIEASFSTPLKAGKQFQSSDISVVMGVNGTLEGQIICSMEENTALSIVGTMMGGMEISKMDDMGWSAIQEFGNWVAGKAASELTNTSAVIDISPPVVNEGVSTFRMEQSFITLPLQSTIGNFYIHVSMRPTN
ncbi:chemotaxis protein CheX [Alteribacillus sp. YIM 98480]|uniref:chemotaxis protein CheX n=1 Tax=Alteribacillus sp. YIM 98480 TaxID=2606599 RepID=UPI001E58492D|nr:chemotaxis protein CheX [Alteribacillus sp. YIM 98480]